MDVDVDDSALMTRVERGEKQLLKYCAESTMMNSCNLRTFQALCHRHGVPAQGSKVQMFKRLAEWVRLSTYHCKVF
jgi:hypothetical protein